jgi:hypothetical protein
MLKQIFSLYIESLLLTTALIGCLSGILILARMASRKDKTAKARQAHLFDVLLIDIMTIPILSFAVMGILLVLKA